MWTTGEPAADWAARFRCVLMEKISMQRHPGNWIVKTISSRQWIYIIECGCLKGRKQGGPGKDIHRCLSGFTLNISATIKHGGHNDQTS